MKNNIKSSSFKLLAVLLTALMAVAVFPMNAFALTDTEINKTNQISMRINWPLQTPMVTDFDQRIAIVSTSITLQAGQDKDNQYYFNSDCLGSEVEGYYTGGKLQIISSNPNIQVQGFKASKNPAEGNTTSITISEIKLTCTNLYESTNLRVQYTIDSGNFDQSLGSVTINAGYPDKFYITGAENGQTFNLGDYVYLGRYIEPYNMMAIPVAWSSSNTSVMVPVNWEFGQFRAVGYGTTTLTVTLLNGTQKTASVTVNVSKPITSLTLDKTEYTTFPGETFKLKPIYEPSDATADFTYTSSNEQVARVDALGNVTGVLPGKATIKVTSKTGSKISAECVVTVSAEPIEVKLNKTKMQLERGENEALAATVTPDSISDKSVVWSSSDKSVALVNSNGVVYGLKEGTAIITAAASRDQTKIAVCVVTVGTPEPVTAPEAPENVTTDIRSDESVNISWDAVDDADYYRVYMREAGGSYSRVATTSKTSFTKNDLDYGKTYYIRVRCYKTVDGENIYSEYAPTVKVQLGPQAPDVKLTKASSTSVKISYNDVDDAENYRIYMKEAGGSYSRVGTTTKTSFTKYGLKKGTTYYVRVRGVDIEDGKYVYGQYSVTKKITL